MNMNTYDLIKRLEKMELLIQKQQEEIDTLKEAPFYVSHVNPRLRDNYQVLFINLRAKEMLFKEGCVTIETSTILMDRENTCMYEYFYRLDRLQKITFDNFLYDMNLAYIPNGYTDTEKVASYRGISEQIRYIFMNKTNLEVVIQYDKENSKICDYIFGLCCVICFFLNFKNYCNDNRDMRQIFKSFTIKIKESIRNNSLLKDDLSKLIQYIRSFDIPITLTDPFF